jgi:hypothetical protein
VLHWFYFVTATCFDPYFDHHHAVFLNTSLIIELSQYGSILVLIVKIVMTHVFLANFFYILSRRYDVSYRVFCRVL